MKRKLDQDGVPTPVQDEGDEATSSAPPTIITTPPTINTFEQLNLDTRLLQAIAKEGFSTPTPVQARAIPLALEGRDVLAQARTGSGKTAAYLLPVLDRILQRKSVAAASSSGSGNGTAAVTEALILVPTRELADQVAKTITALIAFCGRRVRAVNLAQKAADSVLRSLLAERPDVVVATPAGAQLHATNGDLNFDDVSFVVLDEADLLFSYGYEEDLSAVAGMLPGSVQTVMASATLSADVEPLKELFCKDPVVLELEDAGAAEEDKGVKQYVVKCGEEEKFLLIYVIFKLKLVKGKCIVFVASIDRCYRLKLYLEQFGIRSCVLNSELPVNSRIHVVEEFNKNVYDIIIASDEHEVLGSEGRGKKAASGEVADEEDRDQKPSKKRKTAKKSKGEKEYGISRGIDFKNVACVLNFDLPSSSKSYTHRIGRTGRAGRSGMALSFVIPSDQQGKHKPTSITETVNDDDVLADIIRSQGKKGQEVQDYAFDEKAVDAFRYRMNDALRAVTGMAVREARTRELRQELINSDKLKRHFEENPQDLHHLRHDGELRAARVQAHLKHVPDYLMPDSGAKVAKDIGFVGFQKSTGENRIRKARERNRAKGRAKTARRDPLKTFSAKSRRK